MTRAFLSALLTGTAISLAPILTAKADETPRVVATIPPLAAIAADIMAGVGEPDLLIDSGGSPHAYTLRPSDASELAAADYVLWIGEDLELFLADKLDNLAPNATLLTAVELPGVALKEFRTPHDHSSHGGGHDEHGHKDHDDHAHSDHHDHDHGHDDHDHGDHEKHADHEDHHGDHHDDHGHDDHGHGHDDHHGHNHTGTDPHIWMAPDNAVAIARGLADALSKDLPEAQAARVRSNLANFQDDVATLTTEITENLAPYAEVPFLTFHDAYQYFEATFPLNYHGSITVSPEVQPGAASLRALREEISEHGIKCIFSEPQFEPRAIRVVAENLPVRTGMIDPLGDDSINRIGGYQAFMTNLAEGYADCLGSE